MSAVLAILAALVPFVIWLVKRKAALDELPATRLKRHEDEAREVIADRDIKRINIILDRRLRDTLGRNPGGQRGGVSEARPAKPEGGLSGP